MKIGYPTWMLLLLIAISAALFDPDIRVKVTDGQHKADEKIVKSAPSPVLAIHDDVGEDPNINGRALAKEVGSKDRSVAPPPKHLRTISRYISPLASNLPTGFAAMFPSTTDGQKNGFPEDRVLESDQPKGGARASPVDLMENMCGKCITVDVQKLPQSYPLNGKASVHCEIAVDIKHSTDGFTATLECETLEDKVNHKHWEVFSIACLDKRGHRPSYDKYMSDKEQLVWTAHAGSSCKEIKVIYWSTMSETHSETSIPKCTLSFVK